MSVEKKNFNLLSQTDSNVRAIELMHKKEQEGLTKDEEGEMRGLFAHPNDSDAQALVKLEYLASEGLAEMTAEQKERLRVIRAETVKNQSRGMGIITGMGGGGYTAPCDEGDVAIWSGSNFDSPGLKVGNRQESKSPESLLDRNIDGLFNATPVEELGALYAVIRIPKDEESRGRVGYLVKAIAHKYGQEIARRAVSKISSLEKRLNTPIEKLCPHLIAKIENRPIGQEQGETSMFAEFCKDREFVFFLDRLGLSDDIKNSLIKSLLDMESGHREGDADPGREIAQFLEAVAIEAKKRLEPRYWERDVINYFKEEQTRFDEVFDQLEKEGIPPDRINPEYALYANLNVDWIRRGREWVYQELSRIVSSEIERITPPSSDKLRSFIGYLKTKISPENWAKLEKSLGFDGIDTDGLCFVMNNDELKRHKFDMERAALFLNPINRAEIESNPFYEPELAVILEEYRRENNQPKPQPLERIHALRVIQSIYTRISDLTISDAEFGKSVIELLKALQICTKKDMVSMFALIGRGGGFDEDTRKLILNQIDELMR